MNQKRNSKVKIFNFAFWFLLFTFYFLLFCNPALAKEITILYTGETHAMLYTCSCPKEQDGGISRRSTLVKQLKEKYPASLLLDSGGFFAGGLMDEYTQNTQLDMGRTLVNLKAMELMRYDALAVGDDEFNFGRDFLQENIAKTHLNFLSCNIRESGSAEKAGLFKPYLIKEVLGFKIGIIGVTTLSAVQKAGGMKFIEPKSAVAEAVKELKKSGVGLIVLLSHLGESEDMSLINDVSGIDILFVGHSRLKEEASSMVKQTLVVRPSWQGRRLGKLSLTLGEGRITDYKVEELRLSDQVVDDPAIVSILPRCFSDSNCKKEGALSGSCSNPGSPEARCLFSQVNKVGLTIITLKECVSCDTQPVIATLKKQFPGLDPRYLYYPESKEADSLIKDLGISGLPAYLLGKEAEKEKRFVFLEKNADLKGDFYMLNPQFSGVAYFLNRKNIKEGLDIFLSLYEPSSADLLDALKEFNPKIHFLAVEHDGRFEGLHGNLEAEDCLRSVCVEKYYPEYFWGYISCRAKNINSSWWEECLVNLDAHNISSCARGSEGTSLLRENISLNKELGIMLGPTYLLDNQQIFASKGVPSKEELRKIIKR